MELANLMAMLAGLEKAIHQEASFVENLGQEVSETLNIFGNECRGQPFRGPVTGILILGSHRVGNRTFPADTQRTQLAGVMNRGTWLDPLVAKLNELGDKLAPPPSPYRLFTPYARVRSRSFNGMPSMNESVAQSAESQLPGQAAQEAFTLEREYMAMPESTDNSVRR
ncbi:hypothetical protein BJV74DRAFT_882795 [Russula compacta]|nr:hypothetical protein BJV74DRAFT_882795 [Russula compacta]